MKNLNAKIDNLLLSMQKDIGTNKRIINFINTFKCAIPGNCKRCKLNNICDIQLKLYGGLR